MFGPSLIGGQSLGQSRQRKDRLFKRGVEQGVADELRWRFAFAHMLAVLLMQAVRQSEQPSDLSDGFFHKFCIVVSELMKENSEESDGFDRLPANGVAQIVHWRVVFALPSAANTVLMRAISNSKAMQAFCFASGESTRNTS